MGVLGIDDCGLGIDDSSLATASAFGWSGLPCADVLIAAAIPTAIMLISCATIRFPMSLRYVAGSAVLALGVLSIRANRAATRQAIPAMIKGVFHASTPAPPAVSLKYPAT